MKKIVLYIFILIFVQGCYMNEGIRSDYNEEKVFFRYDNPDELKNYNQEILKVIKMHSRDLIKDETGFDENSSYISEHSGCYESSDAGCVGFGYYYINIFLNSKNKESCLKIVNEFEKFPIESYGGSCQYMNNNKESQVLYFGILQLINEKKE